MKPRDPGTNSTMHLGKHHRSVDDKGRIAMPATFRDAFDDTGYIAKAPGHHCLTAYLPSDFTATIERLESLLREGQATQNEYRQFTSSAVEISFDAQGRFRLPKELRDAARIEDSAIVAGVGTRIEIWNPDLWAGVEDDTDSLRGERWL